MKRLTLAIDTSATVSAAVAVGGEVTALNIPDTRAHVEQLVPLCQQALAQAGIEFSELTDVAVGVGPGPFTGLRVGVAAARVIAEALGIRIKGVCSLDVLARQSNFDGEYVAVNDARRKELYWARYQDGVRLSEPAVTAPEAIPPLPRFGPADIDAGILALYVDEFPDAGLEPLYLRRPDAEVPSKPKSALPVIRRRAR
ncbi:MAG: tRNA (adenosine(37)-N6)-threonylcarbamoyltransferase complex dimerization subunit type 1 TsaB [Propionibacteriaceae bacterium]|jgi:tRNA threonylcarbamoyl adenosine modification protein YeaZ|nr:tRNA (adenosine(37)-N6)-threonylcarbamoyltransferase complex dimerization subunit type 1 TsaB [Propionibacteriaceae bacterium]